MQQPHYLGVGRHGLAHGGLDHRRHLSNVPSEFPAITIHPRAFGLSPDGAYRRAPWSHGREPRHGAAIAATFQEDSRWAHHDRTETARPCSRRQ
jgi:hypothetical protein